MGEADVRRQSCVGSVVIQVVAHVGEEGQLRLEEIDQCDRVSEMGVREVGGESQRVENKEVQVLEERRLSAGMLDISVR